MYLINGLALGCFQTSPGVWIICHIHFYCQIYFMKYWSLLMPWKYLKIVFLLTLQTHPPSLAKLLQKNNLIFILIFRIQPVSENNRTVNIHVEQNRNTSPIFIISNTLGKTCSLVQLPRLNNTKIKFKIDQSWYNTRRIICDYYIFVMWSRGGSVILNFFANYESNDKSIKWWKEWLTFQNIYFQLCYKCDFYVNFQSKFYLPDHQYLIFSGEENERGSELPFYYTPQMKIKNRLTKIKTNFVINVVVIIIVIKIAGFVLNINSNQITVYIADVAFFSVPIIWIIRSDEIRKYTLRKLTNICQQCLF